MRKPSLKNDLGRPYREGGRQNRSTGRAGGGTVLPVPQYNVAMASKADKVNETMELYHEQERIRSEQRVRACEQYVEAQGRSPYFKQPDKDWWDDLLPENPSGL
jgi:hypothetical protein